MRTFRPPTLPTLGLLTTLLTGCGREATPAGAAPPTNGELQATSVEDLRERTVRYVISIQQPSDASPDAIATALGVTLEQQYGDADNLIARNQRLADGFGFYVTHARPRDGTVLPVQEVMLFPPEGKTLSGGPDGVCAWQEEDVAPALEAAGYHRGGEVPFNEGRLRSYTRSVGAEDVQLEVGLLTFPTAVGDVPTVCLHGIRLAQAAPAA